MTHPARAEFIKRALFGQSAIGIAVMASASTRIVECNDRFCAIVGLDPATAVGTTLGAIAHPDDAPQHAAAIEAIRRGETDRYVVEKRYRHADGKVVWARVMTSPLALPVTDRAGPADALDEGPWHVAIVEDITALHETAAWHRCLWDTTPEAVLTVGADHRIRAANPAVHRIFGHPPASLVGQPVGLLQPERFRQPGRGWIAAPEAGGSRVPAQGPVDVVGLRRDGTEFPLELSINSATVLGEAVWVAFLRDISERRQTEQLLKQNEERLALALAAGKLGSWDWSVTADLLEWSDAAKAMFGLPPSEPVTLARFVDLVHPDDRAAVTAAVESALTTGQDYRVEFRAVWPDGTERWILAQGKPQAVRGGRAERMTGLVQDVTERVEHAARQRALEEKLRRAETLQALGTFASGIAHDFNNMLSVVTGGLVLARRAMAEGTGAGKAFDHIEIATRRARELVREILAFARDEPAHLVDVVLQPLVEETAQLLRTTLPAGVAIETSTCDEPVHVMADRGQLQRVLMNLVVNASQALAAGPVGPREGGRIRLSVARGHPPVDARLVSVPPSGWAVLRVSDNGMGMTDDVRQRLFQPFFTTKSSTGGTGLGLSVVHGIVTAHHGHIDVHSTPGEGTVFDVHLPLSVAAPAAPRVSDLSWLDGPRHVLYVDDDEVVSLVMCQLMRRNGYEVRSLAGPAEALALARDPAHRIDLVITDFDMPGMSGADLAAALRTLRPNAAIVIASGTVDARLLDDASRRGAWHVVLKEQLVEALERRLTAADSPPGRQG